MAQAKKKVSKKKATTKKTPKTKAEVKKHLGALIQDKKALPESYRAKMGGHSLVADVLDDHIERARRALNNDDHEEMCRCCPALENAQAVK
jgi:DNA-binding MurR/RpiR family transcriptional regulator